MKAVLQVGAGVMIGMLASVMMAMIFFLSFYAGVHNMDWIAGNFMRVMGL